MINEKSILKNLPNDQLTEREIVFYQAITHCIEIIGISYTRLLKQLNEDKDNLASEMPMIDVWNIVDSSHRLRCILEKTPGIKKKESWFQIITRKLRETEKIRNFIQHYNREIDTLIEKVYPLLGHLTWVKQVDNKHLDMRVIVPGNLREKMNLKMVNPVGKPLRANIDLVTFLIGNYEISISDIYYKLIELIIELEIILENKTWQIRTR